MKKFLSVVVVCMMLLTMSVSVFADGAVVVDPTTAQIDGSWTTAGVNADYAGKMMTILVYTSGTTPSVDSIQYIDQTTADGVGAYSFANYLPKVDPTGTTEYVVKVGGQTLAEPLDAGTIKAAVTGAKFAGTVTFAGAATGATIALTPAGGEAKVITTETDGTFDATVNKGTYTLVVSKAGHTTYTYNSYEVTADKDDLAFAIYGGDIDENGVVALDDLSALLANYQVTIEEDTDRIVKLCDIDENDVVALDDLSTLLANYQVGNVVEPAPAE